MRVDVRYLYNNYAEKIPSCSSGDADGVHGASPVREESELELTIGREYFIM